MGKTLKGSSICMPLHLQDSSQRGTTTGNSTGGQAETIPLLVYTVQILRWNNSHVFHANQKEG